MKKIFFTLLIIISLLSFSACRKNNMVEEIPDKLITYTIPDNYQEFYKDLFYYMPKEDLTGNHGSIAITVYESDNEYSKEFLEELKEEYSGYNNASIKHYKTSKYDGVEVIVKHDNYDLIEYTIPSGYMTVKILAFDYHNYPSLRNDLKSIIDSLDI